MTIRRAHIAIAIIFMLNGLTLSAWVSRIPAIVSSLHMSTGTLGTVMIGMAIGALVSFPLAGRLIDTIGSARTTFVFGLLFPLMLPILALTPTPWMLMLALMLFGFGNGGLDLAMNAQGIEIEARSGRSIINSLHGFFSLGGFLGAGFGAIMAWQRVEPFPHFLVVAGIGTIVIIVLQRYLIVDSSNARKTEPAPLFSVPNKALVTLGLIAFCSSVGEGAMNNWSALYMSRHLQTTEQLGAIAYAVFSLAMLTGRFSGDRLVERMGPARLIRRSGVVASVGLLLAILVDQPWSLLPGFAAVGLGLAVVYPLVFSAAGNHPEIPRGQAVAGTATVGYTGFLLGPPLLGWIAEATSMRSIMLIVVMLAAVAAVMAPATERYRRATT